MSCFTLPTICLISVDFPAPLGPIKACISSKYKSIVISSVTLNAPYDLDKFLIFQ